ncbi:MAG: ParB/RepB/Spo0J family partition protein [Candidatus Sulfotelmatobacter sp.]
MSNTVAAENLAGRVEKDKEKVEKRRALGRGLESLLPGPRVVGPGQSGGTADKQQVPHFVRNDKTIASSSGDAGTRTVAPAPHRIDSIQAVVEDPEAVVAHHGALGRSESPLLAEDARNGAPGESTSPPSREEREKGGALASTLSSAHASDLSSHSASDETITIYAQAESRMPANLVVNLEIAVIDKNPFQTRYVDDDEALEELADSIKANGVVQPIMVRPGEEDGRYILVLGERRLLASKKAGKTTIPALVRKVSLQQAAEMTIVENLQREDLSALEQAEAFRVLSNEFKMTQQQIGERVGLSRASVTNYMRLLKLPREVMQLLAEKRISFAEAKELLKLENDDQISKAALYAVKKGLTLEQIERLVLSMNGDLDPFPGMPGQVVKKSGARWVDPNVRSAQTDLERMLGVRVRIRDRKGKGKIVIEYSNVDDYERVVEMLRGKK